MKKNKIQMMILSETKINQNSKETHDDYTFYFSTDITDAQRNQAIIEKEELKQKRIKQAAEHKKQVRLGTAQPKTIEQKQAEWKENAKVNLHIDGEALGMAIIYESKLEKYITDINQHDGRNMTISFKTTLGNISFTGTHAPHAGSKETKLQEKQTQEKIKYYQKLREIDDMYGKSPDIHYIGGDFNARLVLRVPIEETILGPYIFTKEDATLDVLNEQQKENRDLFVDFCTERGYIPMNTWFQKKNEDLVTYRTTYRAWFSPPFDFEHFAQMDYVLAKNQWKNSVINVDSKVSTPFESDHKEMEATFRVKLAKKEKIN